MFRRWSGASTDVTWFMVSLLTASRLYNWLFISNGSYFERKKWIIFEMLRLRRFNGIQPLVAMHLATFEDQMV
jgi:hypothetical protein